MRYIVYIMIFFLYSSVCGQYSLQWHNTYGGNNRDEAHCVIETSDNGLVMAGYSMLENENKYLQIVKIDFSGNLMWKKIFRDHYSSEANDIIECDNEDILIAGTCIQDGQYSLDSWILRLDPFGSLKWEHVYQGSDIGDDATYGIIEIEDGGFVTAGFKDAGIDYKYDAWVMKIDQKGNKVWEATYGGVKDDCMYDLCLTHDGKYMLAGYTESYGLFERGSHRNLWILKVDEKGVDLVDKTFGASYWDQAAAMCRTSDGGYAIAGYTKEKGVVNHDFLILKIDQKANLLWQKVYGESYWDEASGIIETTDKGLAFSGYSRDKMQMNSNFRVFKLDQSGNEIWNTTFKRKSLDYAYDIIETSDKGLLLAGCTLAKNDAGWQMAALKYLNDNRPSIVFDKPSVDETISPEKRYTVRAFISSKYTLKGVELFLNDKQEISLSQTDDQRLKRQNDSTYLFQAQIQLKKGENIIFMKSTNDGGTEISNKSVIRYRELPVIVW